MELVRISKAIALAVCFRTMMSLLNEPARRFQFQSASELTRPGTCVFQREGPHVSHSKFDGKRKSKKNYPGRNSFKCGHRGPSAAIGRPLAKGRYVARSRT